MPTSALPPPRFPHAIIETGPASGLYAADVYVCMIQRTVLPLPYYEVVDMRSSPALEELSLPFNTLHVSRGRRRLE
jgi:hypothetical protein